MAAQADREKVTIITAVTEIDGSGRRVFNLSKDLDVLEGHITEIGDVELVAIDPVDAYLGAGAGGIDSHKNAAVRAVLEPLSELADRLRTAVLAVTHFARRCIALSAALRTSARPVLLSRWWPMLKMKAAFWSSMPRTIWPRPRRGWRSALSSTWWPMAS